MKEAEYLSRRAASGALSRRDFLARTAALGVSAALSNTLYVKAVRAAGPQRGGTLRAGMQGGESTNSLDPATWQSQIPYKFGRQWGEQIVQITADGEIVPCIADEWDSSPDAKTWTFRIRKDVEFHNGKTLTVADVVATIERHADKDSKSGALGLLGDIADVRADGDTVVFTLKNGNADLPYLLTDYHLMIQPNGGKDDPAAGIGTGPYKVVVNEPGIRHVGERFANYWRDDRGFADAIEITVINDTTARISALQSGQVDMINRVEPKTVALVSQIPGITIQNVTGRGHYVFAAHCDKAPFSNNDLRLALKYAIDREQILDKILHGYGSLGNDTPVNSAYPLFTESKQRAFDPDKAAFHYKKSGHDGAVVLRTSDVAFPGAVDAAQLYQQSAAKCGITLEVMRVPGDGYWSDVWNKQPFCASYWSGKPTQDQVYANAYVSTADWNDTRFFREDFDSMLYAARSELDPDKRKALYADMATMVRDEGGVIVPVFNNFIDATGPRVHGWLPDGNQDLMGGYALSKCWIVEP